MKLCDEERKMRRREQYRRKNDAKMRRRDMFRFIQQNIDNAKTAEGKYQWEMKLLYFKEKLS